jgi:branched-chain amino acid transport system substrate-binding protein
LNTIRLLFFWLAALSCAFAQELPPIVVGAVISQTGAHAEFAADYARGIELWRDEVNAAGGLLGRRVELRVLDDGSQAVRAGPLYMRLIGEEKADLLIGPYGSAATLVAAAEVERARRVMVNGAGQAAAIHGRGPKYVFQTTIPYAAYGTGVLQVAAEAGYRQLFIVARDEVGSREMAEGALKAAGADFSSGEIELYRPGTLDFSPQVLKARAAGAETWIAFGDVRDAAEMVKTFKKLDYAPPLFFARAASHPRFIALLGQDAEWSLGAVDFDPRVGAAAREFARAFAAKWTVPPGLAAAEGYAAGSVLAAAVRRARTLEQGKLRAALAELEMPTVLGPYKASPQNGAQIGAKPVVVQIRRGRLEGGPPLLPYPQWNERAPIR